MSFFEKYRSVQISEDPISSPPLDDKLRLRLEVDKYLGESAQPFVDPIQYWANTLWLHKPSQTQVATQAFLNGYTSLLNGYTSLLNPLATTQVYYAKKKFPPKRNNQPHEVAKH
ncbi:hypothetical protein QR680_006664 [Steinernema hermaphroditum]|uniref:Uncharacterized protein n=1 Tax=Steinernema hermaphroditum TaxID=289476 RepID=A0AA39LXG7_9BILA|nr:hypothetical protein QR680_006664 [Steinernema hermaphroditum]